MPFAQVSDKSSRSDSEFQLHFRQSLLNFEVRIYDAVAAAAADDDGGDGGDGGDDDDDDGTCLDDRCITLAYR
jgi:hypothetical protein